MLSRALRQLHISPSCFDWFAGLSASFVAGLFLFFFSMQLKITLPLICDVVFTILRFIEASVTGLESTQLAAVRISAVRAVYE